MTWVPPSQVTGVTSAGILKQLLSVEELVLCQTSKLGLLWQFEHVKHEFQYVATLKSKIDRVLDND